MTRVDLLVVMRATFQAGKLEATADCYVSRCGLTLLWCSAIGGLTRYWSETVGSRASATLMPCWVGMRRGGVHGCFHAPGLAPLLWGN